MSWILALALLMIVGGVFVVIYYKKKSISISTPIQNRLDHKAERTNTQVNCAPTETRVTKPIENKIENLNKQVQEIKNSIQEKEKDLQEAQNKPPVSGPIANPQDAANWVNTVTLEKKILCFLFFVSTCCFAAEPLYKGKSFVPKFDGVALSIEEINSMKEKIEEGERQAKLNRKYADLIEDYKKLKDIQQQQIDQFILLDKLKQESVDIYRESITSYKNIISEMRSNTLMFEKQLGQQKRISRWQRNLNFLLGFAAPILGARALDSIR